MDLIFILNGKQEDILKVQNFDKNKIKFIKIDDKHLSKPKFLKSKIKQENYNNVFFSSKDMTLQRFHFFMLFYILFYNSGKGALIDDKGLRLEYSSSKLFLKYFPLLVIEGFISIFVVLYFYIKLPVLKWKLMKNN